MSDVDLGSWAVLGVALVAAAINGGLGYGFSSITVPAALLVHTSRLLNPALVLVELVLNGYALVINRRTVPAVLPRLKLLIAGAVPGVMVGSFLLAVVSAHGLKLATYLVLLPLVVLQSLGVRRPIKHEARAALPVGFGIGALYAATTLSGPPLALVFNNQGLSKDEFRAALAVFRFVESSLTAVSYLALGVFTAASVSLAASFVPAVAIGLPLGRLVLRNLEPELFRRSCMAFDAVLVVFGLSMTLKAMGLVT
ncbi:MAG: sulfite exporter TauE/SafE family protein [Deltaproteobacteria bacterium]|nr:sulfite exporter TauE/SafE family protein [Deltaproteobacteria bacterium]